MLTFDPVPHEYKWSGRRVPSVTQLLDRLHSFAGVPMEILDAAKRRGSYVHDMCDADDANDLADPDAELAGQYGGYLLAWRKFRADYAPEWAGTEERGYSERYGFAGTLDNRGTLGKFGVVKWIIDKKTSAQTHPVWGMQVAAYRQLVAERDPSWLMARRATVRLAADGTYKFDEWQDPGDWPAFQSLLTLQQWCTRNRIKEQQQ